MTTSMTFIHTSIEVIASSEEAQTAFCLMMRISNLKDKFRNGYLNFIFRLITFRRVFYEIIKLFIFQK